MKLPIPGRLAAARLPVSFLDVRIGARLLLRHPLMTLVSVLSLAIGIPVGLTPMHAVDAFEAPLPVENGADVLSLGYRSVETLQGVPSTFFDFSVWSEAVRGFAELGAVRTAEYNLDPGTGAGAPVAGAAVTASTFPLLRAAPRLGRGLAPEDELPGSPPVVVLGHDVWQSRFQGDPAVVGGEVLVGGVAHTVIGVMPDGFLFPVDQQMWLPLRERPAAQPGAGAPLQVFGRLAPGTTPAEADAELDLVRQRLVADFPEAYAHLTAEAVPFTIALLGLPRGGMRSVSGMWLVQLTSLLLLLVACVNVGLLIFARTAMRSGELAVRSALGAGRARIVGQVFVEALVLALVATVAGLLLMELIANRVVSLLWAPGWGGVPWWVDLGPTPTTVAKAILLAFLSAAVASIIPALRVTGRGIQEPLRRAGSSGSGARMGPLTSTLILVDMALAVAAVGMVAAASDRMTEMANPRTADLPAEQFLAAEITLPAGVQPAAGQEADAAWSARVAAAHRGLVERLQAEPGVRGVAVAGALPRMDHPDGLAELDGGTPGDRFGAHEVEIAHVDPGFFEALGQQVLSGRGFHSGDLQGERTAVLVNRTFAERTLGGRSPVGRRLRYVSYTGEPGPWYEVVGVVPDLATNLAEPQNGLGIYHAAAPGEIYPLLMAIRVGPDPTAFTPRLRELAAEADPAATVVTAEALHRVVPDAWYGMNGFRIGWSVFVGILLVLAASGVYTMMAFSVSQRTREIGIRSALGARPAQIARVIGGRAAMQVGLGALVGMPLAGWAYFQIQQYTTSASTVFVVAVLPGVLAMLLVGLLACTAPLLRALRIEPREAMRVEG